MKTDPTVDRIRQIRHEISEECDHDPKKLIEYYMKYQKKYKGRLITSPRITKRVITKKRTVVAA